MYIRNGQRYKNIKNADDPQLKTVANLPSSLKVKDYYMTMGTHLHNRHYFYPKIISSDEIHVKSDNLEITGMWNGAKIVFEARVDAVFKNNSRGRVKVVLKPILVDITAFAQQTAARGGVFTLTHNNSVETKFPMGDPFKFSPHQTITLVDEIKPIYTEPLRYLDPMKSMPTGMWNLFLQQMTGDNLGTIRFKRDQNDSLLQFFIRNNELLRREIKKDWVTKEELESFSGTFLVRKFVAGENTQELHTFLSASKDAINEFQSNGDFSGDDSISDTGRHQRHENTRVHMKKSAKLKAGGDLTRETTKYTTQYKDKNTTTIEDHAMPQQTVSAPDTTIAVKGNYGTIGTCTVAIKLDERVKGKTRKKTLNLNKTTINQSSRDDVFSSHYSIDIVCDNTHLPSTEIVGEVVSQSDTGIELLGVAVSGEKYKFTAPKVTIDAAIAENSHYSKKESSSGFSTTVINSQEKTPTIMPSVLDVTHITFDSPSVKVTGSDIISKSVDASKEKDGFQVAPAMARGSYYHECVQQSPTSCAESGALGWYDVMRASQIIVDKLILSTDPNAQNFFDTAILNPDIKIIGDYVEKMTELQSHHERWSCQSQAIPTPVVYMIAAAMAAYAGGFAATIGNALAGAGTMCAAAIKAGIQVFCARYAGALASHGDPVRATEDVTSPESLQEIGAAMVSAGALDKISKALEFNMAPGQTDFASNLARFGLTNAVRAGANIALRVDKPGKALGSALRKTVVESVGAFFAHQIGINIDEPAVKLAAHSGLSAGISLATGGKAWEGAGAAALSEFLALTTIDALALQEEAINECTNLEDSLRVYAAKLEEKFQWIRMISSLMVGLAGGDPARADFIAGNVLEHNFGTTQGAFQRIADDDEEVLSAQQLLIKQREERAAFVKLIEEVLEEEALSGLKSPSWSKPTAEDKIRALWQMFKDDFKEGVKHYADRDYIKILASLPIPGSQMAAIACEGRDIYRGNQTFAGATFELAVGIVQGKIVIGVVKHTAKGVKYVWRNVKNLGQKIRHHWCRQEEIAREEIARFNRDSYNYNPKNVIKLDENSLKMAGLTEFKGHLEMVNHSYARIFVVTSKETNI